MPSHCYVSTLQTIACQAPLSMGFSRQTKILPFPPSRDLPDPGIEPVSPALPADSLPPAIGEAQEREE